MGEGKEGVGQRSEREGKSRYEAGDKDMKMEGKGGPLSQILDMPLTVQRTLDRRCSTAYECRVMFQLPPVQSKPQIINIHERSGVYYTLQNPPTPGKRLNL
jgi:hypothetical protein